MKQPQPDLHAFRWIVVNSSGGKDSQTALREVVRQCDEAGVSRDRIVVAHSCLGRMEWPGTLELVRTQADVYGLRLEVESYRDASGAHLSLLDYARKRRKWPDSRNRWCTSELKRSPGGRVLTKLSREAPGDILVAFGFRAEESPARAKRKVLTQNKRFSSRRRKVWDWLPIHDWTVEQVWEHIKCSKVPYHPAYKQGMPRLSCVFCIFAPRAALLLAGKLNPALLDEYCAVEAEIGHTFQNGHSLASVRDGLKRGESGQISDWRM